MSLPIYLDYNATTRMDDRVLAKMLPYFQDQYANSSSNYSFGRKAKEAIEESRQHVADLLNCNPEDILFTSGATESVNLAIKGYALANSSKGRHIISIKTEHKAVLDTCRSLTTMGFDITLLDVDQSGQLSLEDLEGAIRPNTILVAAMYSNNEIGVIQPMDNIISLARSKGIAVFSDATQAVGKVPIDLMALELDLMAFSAHKFYGPKGTGGLFIRNLRKASLAPLLHGGGQEHGFRSGTLNTPNIVGLGEAARLSLQEMSASEKRIRPLRDKIEARLLEIPGTVVNGVEPRIFNTTNICCPGLDANALIANLKTVAISNGSACTSSVIEPSHVLKAIGLTDDDALASIRLSIGKWTTDEEIEKALEDLLINIDLFRLNRH